MNKKNLNIHFPFFWLTGSESVEMVIKALDRVHDYGCDGVTVEPRGFSDFKEKWWILIDAILKHAKKLSMKVIIVDEDYVSPTGHVFNKLSLPENFNLRRESLVEAHVDVIGPQTASFVVGYPLMWTKTNFKDELIDAYAYKRVGVDNDIDISNPIKLTSNIKNNILTWDIPEGNYRIEYIFRSKRYAEMNNDDKIDMLNTDAVKLLIDNIYCEYERRYKDFFGNTLIGFFSDEPEVGNAYTYCKTLIANHEFTAIGTPGRTLPYNDQIANELLKIYGDDMHSYMPSLWYWDESISPKFRDDYMNIVSRLYMKNFSEQIGKWCKSRGLIYLGHVLEDGNLHTRLGDGPAHYFRSQIGQTMPGIDIVLHQIMPGFSDTNLSAYGTHLYGGDFYHYILGKLASSMAHTYEHLDGRALCEVTIGYGWAEGSQLAKWLFDYLLVRGTNFFVPGAIRPIFPDIIHAPHFGDNEKREPQELGYKKILGYSRKVVEALNDSEHIANALLLYHAHGEWMNKEFDYMLMEKPAKVLYDNHIDFDILSEDLLTNVDVVNGKCKIKETYDCLVVPGAKRLPDKILNDLYRLIKAGADVLFVNEAPTFEYNFNIVKLENLFEYFLSKNYIDIKVNSFEKLRHYHVRKDNKDVYMFFNEDINKTFNGVIETGLKGNYNIYDFLNDKYYCGKKTDNIYLRLEPHQSCIVVYEDHRGFEEYYDIDKLSSKNILPEFEVELYSYENMNILSTTFKLQELSAISDIYPNFSGKIVYKAKIELHKREKQLISFEAIGENAVIYMNGKKCSFIICKPFICDITEFVKDGENELTIEVFTTLANAQLDPVSMFVPMSPTGISGTIKLLYL